MLELIILIEPGRDLGAATCNTCGKTTVLRPQTDGEITFSDGSVIQWVNGFFEKLTDNLVVRFQQRLSECMEAGRLIGVNGVYHFAIKGSKNTEFFLAINNEIYEISYVKSEKPNVNLTLDEEMFTEFNERKN